jgi:HSP20 family protein
MAEKQSMPVRHEAGERPMVPTPFHNLRDEIDRVFDEFMSWSPFRGGLLDRPLAQLGLRRGMVPAADVCERADAYEIDIDVPGVKTGDIEIAVSGDTLTVRCEVGAEQKEEGTQYYSYERRHETFSRMFGLPAGVDPDGIAADMENGVLKITIPKTAETQKKIRKVEVKPH